MLGGDVLSLASFTEMRKKQVQAAVDAGWEYGNAIACEMLIRRRAPLAKHLAAGDARFAACTYALTNAIDETAQKQILSGVSEKCRRTYKHLRGQYSLTATDPAWEKLGTPDHNGFLGLTVMSPTEVNCGSLDFDEAKPFGFCQRVTKDGQSNYEVQEHPVVCFTCDGDLCTEHGMHVPALFAAGDVAAFPPNTLFVLKAVKDEFFWGGFLVKQKLYIVTATYATPKALAFYHHRREAGQEGGSDLDAYAAAIETKMTAPPGTLSYADREAYIDGLDAILAAPVLTIDMECSRDIQWTDRRGVAYNLKEEWEYVKGPAVPLPGCTPGDRDSENGGKTPEHFRDEVNDLIRQRRAERSAKSIMPQLPESHAYLSTDEVLAVRLYTGPAYAVLNGFLRVISGLKGRFRDEIVQNPELTYTATVAHIIRAIRKLSASATNEEMDTFSGVSGQLPVSFWSRDEKGLVCATDTAFMSTSLHVETPLHYLNPKGQNVLWKLKTSAPDDTGFHFGAVISPLSQFKSEREVLFPPYTMLVVSEAWLEKKAEQVSLGSNGGSYTEIEVMPSFI